MKRLYCLTLLFTLFATGNAHAGGALMRIICDGDADGAEVYINGKLKGECPLEMKVPEGKLSLRVQKATDAEHEPRLFKREMYMGEGVMKKVEVQFGPIELNAAGKRREAAQQAEAQRRKEEAQRREEENRTQAIMRIESEMIAIPGKNFAMGKYEVTKVLWRAVMGDGYHQGFTGSDDLPVESVSWNDIHDFLEKLNQKTGKQYRLPTEAEWEYACHGGSQTEYCGSNDINAVAWYGGNSNWQIHVVGQKQANGYGLYDMSGNVWEWMENRYDNADDRRALRGGSWLSKPVSVRTANRDWNDAANRSSNYGFRLARTLP